MTITLTPLADPAHIPANAPSVPVPGRDALALERPQETWLAEGWNGEILGCCSLWWEKTAALEGRRTGYIGHYAASSRKAGTALLHHGMRRLGSRGCETAVAPINGSTWNGYRFVIGGTDRAPFFMEPRNPPEWTQDLSSAGFLACATYCSAATHSLDYEDPRLHEIDRRLHDSGVTMRCLERSRMADELRRVYALARDSFRRNFLNTVPSEDEFLQMYIKLLDFVRPEYVLLAEQDGDLVGFAFALPDHGQKMRGEAVKTLILKTVAVRRGRAYTGLGRRLICEINEAAKRDGYRTVIHALMHESNASLAYSQRFTRVFRRYALYARRIS